MLGNVISIYEELVDYLYLHDVIMKKIYLEQ